MYVEGARGVAARLGCGATTIGRRLRQFCIAARSRGPVPGFKTHNTPRRWTPEIAYAVGLIATDGNLSKNRAQLSFVSKDLDQVETLRRCLQLQAPVFLAKAPSGRFCNKTQWCDRGLYNWLVNVGLTPAKSLTLGPLAVPDEYFVDFFRGCIDGDGSVLVYTDRYHVQKKECYVYERLYVSLVSASLPFLEWIRATIGRLLGFTGTIGVQTRPGRRPIYKLRYAKRDSVRIIRWMYYVLTVPSLRRKRDAAAPFLTLRECPRRRGPGRPMVL